MVRLSACLIVKNEEILLPHCLGSIRTFVDEIIVVDTGSSDNTIEVARSYGAQVYDFAWVDDFSAARNESLRHATGDWILYIDADESVDESNAGKILRVITRKDIMAVTVRQCIPQRTDNIATAFYSEYCRIFLRHPGIRFEGIVHEQILPSIERLGGKVLRTDIVINHWAYAIDGEKKYRRAERNLKYLLKERERVPNDPFVYLNLGMTYRELGQCDAAINAFHTAVSLDDGQIKRELIGQVHLNLSKLYLETGDNTKTTYHAKQAAILAPANPLPVYLLATLAVAKGNYGLAVSHLEAVASIAKGETGTLPDVGIDLSRVYLELGSCRSAVGDLEGAEQDFVKSIECSPTSALPYMLLGNCLFMRGDRIRAEEMFHRALSLDPLLVGARQGLSLCRDDN